MHISSLRDRRERHQLYLFEVEQRRHWFESESKPDPSLSWYPNPLLVPRREHRRNWLNLPVEITLIIFEKLGAIEVLTTVQQVCKGWRTICMDPYTWRAIHMSVFGVPRFMDYHLSWLCRRTIQRSCGLVLDISIDYFADDDLLNHIAHSCGSGLQRLRLNKCYEGIPGKGFLGLAKKFPLLEELDITLCFSITAISIESFGQACPLLKTFKFNHSRPYYYFYPNPGSYVYNAFAFSIALSMPKLRHLQLLGNRMDNDGLLAILNGCPYLESLDLGYCFNLDVTPTLMMLMQGIKDLRLPAVPPDASTHAKRVCLLQSYEKVISRNDGYNFLVEEWHMYQDEIKNAKLKMKGIMFGGDRYHMDHCEEEATRENWEEIYGIWECAKNQRSSKLSRRYLIEKKKNNKNGKLKEKKKRRRKEGASITTKAYVSCFEMEETENSLRYQ
ncbi:hypothetical protein PIB30_070380 [Stylosanthes scabra]|uniref:F-box domain-containing protein n=1 Tax=Stylosanthes scabra TaxID=79078 RepID=A0ABU6WRH3_9FABA|nr:hypothetical protein [Stylosanthes scabra]